MKKKYKDPASIREEDTKTVKEAMNRLLDSFKLKRKFSETQILSAWEDMMGKTISSRTSKLYFKNGVLFCQITSAPLKHKMLMNKDKMINIIRSEFGPDSVSDIVVY
ncbi:DUF721 domain-containing protein [Aureibacter tunicatorum]|uniref:DUF721 domain-containing protein n=1 Tax=Aureibacter tunicatorum TaxID=866807 RepID=A0AAE3XJ66_9BACT|nr:DUF721 domain-containing protein [Aureibacter tunicatorum]MDR6237842.1 hypothetical protein [Aureibacter tunicatorum]BDD02877.1 hypothetical protein AUTU_03600 [Aureibacter tunicatorum]